MIDLYEGYLGKSVVSCSSKDELTIIAETMGLFKNQFKLVKKDKIAIITFKDGEQKEEIWRKFRPDCCEF